MSNMQDVLNTYEGAKPSRLHNDSGDSRSPFSYFASSLYDPAYDSSGGGSTVGGGGNSTTSWYEGEDPQGFCGPGTQRACFWVILATR